MRLLTCRFDADCAMDNGAIHVDGRAIEVIVSPTGESKVETKGFVGAACQEASKFLEDAPGKRASEQPTTDFFQHSETNNQFTAERSLTTVDSVGLEPANVNSPPT